jgi:tRNA-specific 2-thiouridylase
MATILTEPVRPSRPAGADLPPGTLVVAALSGGVDSAVAAGLLAEQGHRVVGMTMRLYDARGTAVSSGGRCCGPRDVEDARAVCAHLGIPFYVVDLAAEFGAAVVDDFVEAYLAGETPNPCVRCNQHVKFTPLLARARAIGADVLVTGHYARLEDGALRRGRDPGKDQSYFLFSMPAHELGAVRFPLGGMTKEEVRAHALRLGLPNAAKPESQEICFVPDGDYAGFVAAAALRRGRPLPLAGDVIGPDGAVLGRHEGTHRFTVGQHRGLGNLATKDKLYVTAVEPARGVVHVGPKAAAERRELTIRDLRWLSPPRAALSAAIQVRHRGAPIAAEIRIEGGPSNSSNSSSAGAGGTGARGTGDAGGAEASVISGRAYAVLAEPTVAAPGQAAVIYAGDRVLAGGWLC